jgi:DegV family protein with EDD domain
VHFDGLDNLVKGGRISGLAGVIGGALNIKLSITVKDGAFVPVRPYRSAKAALKHGLDWVEGRMGTASRGAFCVIHALSEDRALWIKEQLIERFDVTEMFVMETGAVIATHTGTGWGIAFVPEA